MEGQVWKPHLDPRLGWVARSTYVNRRKDRNVEQAKEAGTQAAPEPKGKKSDTLLNFGSTRAKDFRSRGET